MLCGYIAGMVPEWLTWLCYAYVVFFAVWAAGWLIFGKADEVLWFMPRKKAYRLVEQEMTEWGVMFAIISPKGDIVGIDRWKPANERCAALNRQPQPRS
jgi:hypothetical protein